MRRNCSCRYTLCNYRKTTLFDVITLIQTLSSLPGLTLRMETSRRMVARAKCATRVLAAAPPLDDDRPPPPLPLPPPPPPLRRRQLPPDVEELEEEEGPERRGKAELPLHLDDDDEEAGDKSIEDHGSFMANGGDDDGFLTVPCGALHVSRAALAG